MTSPAVWDDALGRATATCAQLGLRIEQVNAPQTDHDPDAIWVLFEVSTSSADRAELGPAPIWEEQGQIWLHLMVPAYTGLRAGIVARKQLGLAFRLAGNLPDGLAYHGMSFDPASSGDEPGNWTRLSLAIDYVFQDITT